MNGNPKIDYKFSIIVPVYNVEKYIINCLKSVINQTYIKHELIIVNDGSTDRSLALIEDFMILQKSSYKIVNQQNAGASTSRNVGIKYVKGDYVIFLDSDDSLELNSLEILNNVLNEYYHVNCIDFICFSSKAIFENGKEAESKLFNYTISGDSQLLNCDEAIKGLFEFQNVSCCVTDKAFHIGFLKKLNKEEYFMPGKYYGEDLLFMVDAIFMTVNVVVTKYTLYRYLFHEGSIMRTSSLKTADDYAFIINYLFQKKAGYPIDEKAKQLLISNYALVQSVTFYQTLKNSKIKDAKLYRSIVMRFKEQLASYHLQHIFNSRFNTIPKNLLARYIRSDLSNNLMINNTLFGLYDYIVSVKNRVI